MMIRWLIGVAVGLTVLHGTLALVWGPGPILAVFPWYVPMMHSFMALAALSIAFLSFGRCQVRCEPAPFWIGMACSLFALLDVFYVLSWPGLLPDERGLIARFPNTAGWLWDLKFGALAAFLLAAVTLQAPRAGTPGERRWPWLVGLGLVVVTAIAGMSLAVERSLPVLVAGGVWSPLQIGGLGALLTGFAAGVVLSARRYRRDGDSLLGYVAVAELLFAFAVMTALIGGKRYDLWWYWQRFLWVGGFSIILFGLLSEYVLLYQREREKTRRLEEQERLREEFIAAAAHELRTPVAGIRGYVGLIRKIPDVRSDVFDRALRAIDDSSDRISRLARELVESAELERGVLLLRSERFDLAELARQVVEKAQADHPGYGFRLEIGPAVVVADSQRIGEVIRHLLDNAVKYQPGGGKIDVSVWPDAGQGVFSVRDYGTGVPPERRPYVFEPMYEPIPPGMPGYVGAVGLGLALSKRIVELHQGRIWLEGGPGQGSTLYFALALAPPSNGRPAS